ATGLRKATTSKYDILGLKYRDTKFSSSTDEAGYEVTYGDVLNTPNNNAIIAAFTYSKYFLIEKESAVSVDLGIGFSYFFKNVYEQGSKFNFIENAGLTYHYSFDTNSALTFGFKINHISNAGIFPPNRGINALSFNAGYSWIMP
ncbi:MAG: acyloxyacyl hydrolase, partial [Armatimonadota bacterium]